MADSRPRNTLSGGQVLGTVVTTWRVGVGVEFQPGAPLCEQDLGEQVLGRGDGHVTHGIACLADRWLQQNTYTQDSFLISFRLILPGQSELK
jgi:hypothetical protein